VGQRQRPRGEEYRQHAADCLRLAQLLQHPGEKAALLRMAEIWRDLAVKADAQAQVQPHRCLSEG